MDYKTLNDNELVYMCSENSEEAINIMIDKYKNCILSILKDLLDEYNIVGVEVADLYQEGLIGLMHAINSFDKDTDLKFASSRQFWEDFIDGKISDSEIERMHEEYRKETI